MDIKQLVLALWQEQARQGLCPADEVDETTIDLWITNRTYPPSILEAAVSGDITALVLVRTEAGLSVIS